MESYYASEHGTGEMYMIQGSESNPNLATQSLGQFEVMDGEGGPEFIVDQGLYYPAPTNYYGYYCTGFESAGEWDDNHRFFGLDSPNLHYAGLQTENLPYVYYTPSYGYAQSPYNPYNPYIPGAVIGVDGSYVGMQQYYPGSTYQHPASSPAYYPIVVQPMTENIPSNTQDPHLSAGVSNANGNDGSGLKLNLQPAAGTAAKGPPRPSQGDGDKIYNLPHSSGKRSEASKTNLATNKQPTKQPSTASGSVSSAASPQVSLGRNASGSAQGADQLTFGQFPSLQAPLEVSIPVSNASSDFSTNARAWPVVEKLRPRLHYGGVSNSGNGNPDFLSEQNRGPRTNRSRGQWPPSTSVEVYKTNNGTASANGKILIFSDQYNKDDFPVNYVDGKFFVIKSYSEDDVHKSIKYNVWSSTPNGNKRLDSAYGDAQRIAAGNMRGCPVFLFFSVNASGQFCGVAEMIGPVDFNKDMDFWQQDKWSGSFPVKWHIIKDVPNTNFRHIILENNENKPVTNSRDTQEIKYRQGMEMLSIFKNYTLKTSILDDFVYYESRQKILQEEKARLHGKTYDSSFYVPAFVPVNKPIVVADQPRLNETTNVLHHPNSLGPTVASNRDPVAFKPTVPNSSSESGDTKHSSVSNGNDVTSVLKIGSMTIDSKSVEANKTSSAVTAANVGAVDGFTVGSKWCFPNSSKGEGNTKQSSAEDKIGITSGSKIGPQSNEPIPAEAKTAAASTEVVDVFTVGSMPVKVNGYSEASSGVLTVGSIPIVPKGPVLNKLSTESSSTGHI